MGKKDVEVNKYLMAKLWSRKRHISSGYNYKVNVSSEEPQKKTAKVIYIFFSIDFLHNLTSRLESMGNINTAK